jgi:hypothetical protein
MMRRKGPPDHDDGKDDHQKDANGDQQIAH